MKRILTVNIIEKAGLEMGGRGLSFQTQQTNFEENNARTHAAP